MRRALRAIARRCGAAAFRLRAWLAVRVLLRDVERDRRAGVTYQPTPDDRAGR